MIWTPNRILALIIGIVFLLIGILGFLFYPNSGAIFGIFDVDVLHNSIHLITGIIALIAVFTGWSRLFNQIFGIVYLLIGIIGLIPGLNNINGLYLGVMHVNVADHLLHLAVGIVCAYVGFFITDLARATPTTPSL